MKKRIEPGASHEGRPDSTRFRVTVAIPTRNRPESVRRAVESVLRGTRLPDEILICDQGEAGGDRPIDRWTGSESRVPIRRHAIEGTGVSANRNRAARAARGDFIAFCDDDMTVDRRWLERMITEWERRWSRGAVVITGTILPGEEFGTRAEVPGVRDHGNRCVFRERPRRGDTLYGGHFGAPRAVFEALRPRPFDERLGPGSPYYGAEDEDFACRALSLGIPVVYEPSIVARHHPEPRSWARRHYFPGIGNGALLAKHVLAGDPGSFRRLGWSTTTALGKVGMAALRGRPGEMAARLTTAGGLAVGFARWCLDAGVRRLRGRMEG